MTPQEVARHQAEIQLAFADGAEIEVRSRLNRSSVWDKAGVPCWNWNIYDYRIAKKPKTAERIKELEQEIADLKASDAETVTLRSYLMLGGELKTFRAGTEPIWDIQPELIKTETIPLD